VNDYYTNKLEGITLPERFASGAMQNNRSEDPPDSYFDNAGDAGDAEVILKVDSQFIKTKIPYAVNYLNSLKNSLSTLNKVDYKATDFNIIDIDNLIKESSKDLTKFKESNGYYDSSITSNSVINNLKIDLHKANTLYGSKYNNELSRSDVYSDKQYEEYNLLNLLIEIQIVILLLENGKNNGRIYLDNLHNLIKLYSGITSNAEFISYDKAHNNNYIEIDDKNNYLNGYTNDYGRIHGDIHASKVIKNVASQNKEYGVGTDMKDMIFYSANTCFDKDDNYSHIGECMITDDYSPLFNESIMKRKAKRTNNNVSHNTQYMYDSGYTALVKRNHIKNYIPLCDINKIKTDKERIKMVMLDTKSRTSLRNDYKPASSLY